MLTPHQHVCVQCCKQFLAPCCDDADGFIRIIVIDDKTWVHHYDTKWCTATEKVQSRPIDRNCHGHRFLESKRDTLDRLRTKLYEKLAKGRQCPVHKTMRLRIYV
jgi:hypothetical protein